MSDEDAADEGEGEDGELEGGDEDGGSSGGGFSGKKIALFAGLPLLLIIGGVAGAYFTGLLDSVLGGLTSEEAEESSPLAGDVMFYDLPEMLVNLNTGGKQTNYLKIKVSLEVENEAMLAQLDNLLPRVVDNFQVYLRELRVEDLNGSAGLYRLKEELLVRVNTAIKPHKVNDVLFREMLVQPIFPR